MPDAEVSREFLRHAVIDTVVPDDANIDIQEALKSALKGGDADDLLSLLSSIPQRSLVFFGVHKPEYTCFVPLADIRLGTDELVPVYIVLRLANVSEEFLERNLRRLEIRLDAFAIDPMEAFEHNPTLTRDLIFSGAVDEKQEPLVVGKDGETGDGHVYVIWNIEAFLGVHLRL